MNSKYLSEAFQQLDLLTEENFALNDEGVEELQQFEDNDDVFKTLDVVDDAAETEEDLQDSYLGKVILECCVCHSKVYKEKKLVNVEEGKDCANIGDECPYCFSTDGYKIIGQVEPFEAPTEFDVTVEPKEECEDGECEVDDNEEDIDEKYCPKCGKDVEEPCEDCKDEIEESLNEASEKGNKTPDDFGSYKEFYDWLINAYPNSKERDRYLVSLIVKDKSKDESLNESEGDEAFDSVPKMKPEEIEAEKAAQNPRFIPGEGEPFAKEKEEAHKAFENSVKEGLENLDIETEHDRIHIAAEEKPETDDEMLAPLSPETEEQVGLVDEIPAEEPVEAPTEETAEGPGEDVDIPIDDFDEEGFDELGESFLKKVYENVNTYKTTGVTSKGNTLTVEGKINFESGKSKNTKFIFEACQATKEGKVKFTGFNEGLTKGKKSFRLNGSVANNRLTVESLGYHFIAKDASGKSGRVNGTVRVK